MANTTRDDDPQNQLCFEKNKKFFDLTEKNQCDFFCEEYYFSFML